VLTTRDVVLQLYAIANDMELDSATKVFPFKNKRAAIAMEYDPKTRKYVFNARQIDSDGDPAGKRAEMGNPFDLNDIALKLFRLVLTTAQRTTRTLLFGSSMGFKPPNSTKLRFSKGLKSKSICTKVALLRRKVVLKSRDCTFSA